METKLDVLIGTLDTFTKAYIEAALWASTDDDDEPLDSNYSERDLDCEALESMRDECLSFQAANADLLAGLSDSQSGHDFWLTRNGHGAGFWDRGLGELGDKLTEASKKAGERHLYIGDNGSIFQA